MPHLRGDRQPGRGRSGLLDNPLHFVTNQVAARRVRQMGEDPASVYVGGSPGLDTLRRMELVEHATLAQEFGCRFCARNLLVDFSPGEA